MTEEECQTTFVEECSEQLEQVCKKKFEQKCERTFETECNTVDEEECTVDYEEKCETVYKVNNEKMAGKIQNHKLLRNTYSMYYVFYICLKQNPEFILKMQAIWDTVYKVKWKIGVENL